MVKLNFFIRQNRVKIKLKSQHESLVVNTVVADIVIARYCATSIVQSVLIIAVTAAH